MTFHTDSRSFLASYARFDFKMLISTSLTEYLVFRAKAVDVLPCAIAFQLGDFGARAMMVGSYSWWLRHCEEQ